MFVITPVLNVQIHKIQNNGMLVEYELDKTDDYILL